MWERHGAWKATVLTFLFFSIYGCSTSDESDTQNITPTGEEEFDISLSGSVGDGPVTSALITIYSKTGEVLATTIGDQSAGYSIELRTKGKNYPLTIEATGGIDMVTGIPLDFRMVSAVTEPRNKAVAHVNPYSTVAVSTAKQMTGGLSAQSLAAAIEFVVGQFNLGMTSSVSLDPMTLPIDDSNLAEIVKSSEGLAEVFRRVAAAMMLAGFDESVDSVVAALAADLVDGVLDGRGAADADRRVAATTIVVAAQVALELMRNELRVHGQIATQTLDDIVRALASGASPDLTESRPVNAYLIGAASGGIDAGVALGGGTGLENLQTSLLGIQTGMSAETARSLLPTTASATMSTSIQQVAGGSEATLDTVLAGDPEPPPPPPPPPGNAAPTISGVPPTSVLQDTAYSFVPSAADADGDQLTFLIANQPSWASFNAVSGRLSGTPAAIHVGTYSNIRISVTDGLDTVSLPAFTITVTAAAPPPNTPPTISGSPASAVEAGSAYSFRPSAADTDGDALTFLVQNQPSWASFSAATGRLNGTPAQLHVGTYSNIRISVSDGQDTVSLPAFTITVTAPPNSPPTISGSPASSALQDAPYSFTPSASDGDGDSLTFLIENQPQWTSFSAATGSLGGTPGAIHVGTYSNIRISVTDGEATASLPAFTITVNAIALGSATLSWEAPTMNTDGSPLQDLAGYEIAWGGASGSYSSSVTVMNPGITTYVVDNLPSGTHFFAVKAINDTGMRSDFSNEASKTIP